jgi:hypothetical protein
LIFDSKIPAGQVQVDPQVNSWRTLADLIKFLLSAAVSSAYAKEKIPDVTKVCEWHFRDLMHLPKAAQEEYKLLARRSLKHSVSTTSLSSPTYQRVIKPLAAE